MLTCTALSLALLSWPSAGPVRRPGTGSHPRWRWSSWPVAPAAGAVGWWAGGPVVALALGLLAWTLTAVVVGGLRDRARSRDEDRVEQAVSALLRELRAGATPEAAVRAVRAEFPDVLALDLLQGSDDDPDPVARRLRDSAALSGRLGLPWSGVLAAVVDDLRVHARVRVARTAAMAGPRLSGWVLAALPVVGILLGYGMGTDPLQVLLHSTIGQVLLLVGVGLTCSGLWWVRRIAR